MIRNTDVKAPRRGTTVPARFIILLLSPYAHVGTCPERGKLLWELLVRETSRLRKLTETHNSTERKPLREKPSGSDRQMMEWQSARNS